MLHENPLTSGMNIHQFSAVTPSNIDVSNFKYKSLEIFGKNHFMVRCTHLGVIIESQYLLNRVLGNPIVNKSDKQIADQTNVGTWADQLSNKIQTYEEEEDLFLAVGIVFSIITNSPALLLEIAAPHHHQPARNTQYFYPCIVAASLSLNRVSPAMEFLRDASYDIHYSNHSVSFMCRLAQSGNHRQKLIFEELKRRIGLWQNL